MINTKVFSGCRVLYILAVFAIGISLFACASGPETKDKGSLSNTFTLVDEQGQKSGSLTLTPLGDAILMDANGAVIGEYKLSSPAEAEPAEAEPAEAEPAEAEPAEAEPAEAEPAEAQPAEAEPEAATTQ